jgi:hypothetical protein
MNETIFSNSVVVGLDFPSFPKTALHDEFLPFVFVSLFFPKDTLASIKNIVEVCLEMLHLFLL